MIEMEKTDFAKILSSVSVPILKSFAIDLGIEIPSKIRKNEITKIISGEILRNLQILLDILFTYELKIIKKIIEQPQLNICINKEVSFPPIGCIMTDDSADSSNQIKRSFIPCDLVAVLSPLLGKEIQKRSLKENKDIEEFILGLVNLKGCINTDDIVNQLSEKPYGKVNLKTYSKLINKSSKLLNRLYMPEYGVYVSPYMDENHKIQLPGDLPQDKKECKFTTEEIKDAADVLNPQFAKWAAKGLIDFLKEQKFSNEYIHNMLFDIWYRKQEGKEIDFKSFLPVEKGLKNINDYLYFVCTYYNRLPYWKTRGWTSFGTGVEIINPPILWSLYQEGEHGLCNIEEYIDFLCDTVHTFEADSFYGDKEENLFLYIEKDDIWSAHVGTDEAKDFQEYYTRIYFPDITFELPYFYRSGGYETLWASRTLIRKFIYNNFDKNFFDDFSPILWKFNKKDIEVQGRSVANYIKFLCEAINEFYGDDPLYRQKDGDEGVFLYIEKDNIWSLYAGPDEMQDIPPFYQKLRLADYKTKGRRRFIADSDLIRKFVNKNFDESLFKKEN